MCTVVVLRRPGAPWPLILAANRDEMVERPWDAPARHWPDRAHVVAGIDRLAGGTWLGVNDDGLVAGVLNRPASLGPAAGFRSRGELPLEALDHACAESAAEALSQIDPGAYRTFNMVVADCASAFWLCSNGDGDGAAPARVMVTPLAQGVSMLTAYDLDDARDPRVAHYLPRFRAAAPPDPEAADWAAWERLLKSREHAPGAGFGGAMCIESGAGFATVSSSLIALPAPGRGAVKPIWRFAAGRPDLNAFRPVAL